VDSLNAYLFVSLRHAAQRIAKRRRSLPASAAQRPLRNALQEDSGRDDVLHHAIDALPDAQREILVLKIDGELTFSEIAAVVGVNANTVASRYRLALESLRTKLKHDA
jgi:RNA polymerase sigma-70 factor (ECF subfamily)